MACKISGFNSIMFKSIFALAMLVLGSCLVFAEPESIASETKDSLGQTKSAAAYVSKSDVDKYVNDLANIVTEDYKKEIAADCIEIEQKARIRVLVRTEQVKDLNEGQVKADGFFSEWIRGIGLDKRGILIYALLPEGTAHGKILLKVGIGLKYLITKEMGEQLLNDVILPSNAENNDGKGFLEGVRSIKKNLLDELARDEKHVTSEPKIFELGEFLWSSKEIIIGLLVVLLFIYIVFFVERCPKCSGSFKITREILKEPTKTTLGLQRKYYVCEKCGFNIRKKEPLYPSGLAGISMRLSGTRRRNVRVD